MKILLWERRREKGYSLRQLARISGVSRSTIERLETGYIPKSLKELEQLADALECSVEELLKM